MSIKVFIAPLTPSPHIPPKKKRKKRRRGINGLSASIKDPVPTVELREDLVLGTWDGNIQIPRATNRMRIIKLMLVAAPTGVRTVFIAHSALYWLNL